MSEVRGFKPIEITPAMVVESSLFDIAPAAYAAGITYAAGIYASVAGALGEILIYKSLLGGNAGNPPSTSPAWWVYSSSTYQQYSTSAMYTEGERVQTTASGLVYESLISGNRCSPLVVGETYWQALGASLEAGIPPWSSVQTYAIGDVVKTVVTALGGLGEPDSVITTYFKNLQSANLNNAPPSSGSDAFWQLLITPYLVFAPNTLYAFAQIVELSGLYWKSKISGNIGTPSTVGNAWVEVSPLNKVAILDNETDTQSVAMGEMSFTINAGVFDSVALIGCEGGVAYVTVRDGLGGAIVFDEAQGISGNIVSDWWAFTYGDATFPLKKAVFTDIPPFINAHITIRIVGDSAVKLGTVDIGSMQILGVGAQYGASVELKDYGVKKTDDFGKTSFVRRGFKEVMDVQILLDKSEFLRVYNIFTDLRSTPWFIQASDDPDWGQALSHHGFYNSFRPVIDYPTHAIYSLQFESLVTS